MKSEISMIAAPAAAMTLVKGALLVSVLLAFAPGAVLADDVPSKGTTPYVTHFVFRPVMTLDVPISARSPRSRRRAPPRT